MGRWGRPGVQVLRAATVAAILGTLLPGGRADAQAITCFAAPPSPIPSEVAVGATPESVVIGDLNGDGKLDLAVANFFSTIVSIRLGAGDGSFSSAPDVAVGSDPTTVAIGDLNGDARPDLAVANLSSNTVSIRLGNGDGTFANAADVAVGSTPASVAIGDLNGDGRPDLVVSNASSNTVSIRLGNGDGSFASAADVAVGVQSRSVAIGDLNGDGKPDLAVVNFGSNTVSIRLGNGDGAFSNAADVIAGTNPSSVALGDLNGDGKLDLAIANSSAGVSIRLGNGDGSFSSAADVSVGSNPRSVAVGDLNGDGRPDLAVANQGSDTVSIRLGNGDGSFSSAADVGVGSNPRSVAVGDLNGDSALDLAIVNQNASTVSIRLNTCDLNLVPTLTVPGAQTVAEDGALVFSAANSNLLSVADDASLLSKRVRSALSSSNGALALATTSGLSFADGDGVSDPTMTFTGTIQQVNAALNGLRYTPTANYTGPGLLTFTVDDQGFSGVGGPRASTASVAMMVTPVNDAPTAVNDGYSVVAQTVLTVPSPGVLGNDTDIDSSPTSFSAAVVANPLHGGLTLNPNGGFTYTPAAGYAGTDSFTYQTSDGSAPSDAATVTITVTPIQCVPRPRVVPSPVAGGDKLQVHVESTPLNTQQNNPLQQIKFGIIQNAKVTLNGQPIVSGQTYTVPAHTVAVDFTVARAATNQPTTVHFTVVDGCGDWKTFVGGGTSAGF